MSRFTTHLPLIRRCARATVRGAAIAAGAALFLMVIFWEADFYAMRDRWEHFKAAVFAPWQNEGECLSEIPAPQCEEIKRFEREFSQIDDFNFFRSEPIANTTVPLTLGVRFTTARDVVLGQANGYWCYVGLREGAAQQNLFLVEQLADDAPVYNDLSTVDPSLLRAHGLSIAALNQAAREQCLFDQFNFTQGNSHEH